MDDVLILRLTHDRRSPSNILPHRPRRAADQARHHPCPLCQVLGRWLEDASQGCHVDCYQCDRCGHVWHQDKLTLNAPAVPVTRARAEAIVRKIVADSHRTLSPEQLNRIINAVAYDLEADKSAASAARLATRIVAMAEPSNPVVKAVKKDER